MKKLIASFAVIGVLALTLIGGPATAATSTPTPSPTCTEPEVQIQPFPLPVTCPPVKPTQVIATTPVVKFDKCGSVGEVIIPTIKGVEYSGIMNSAMHHRMYQAVALPGYVLVDASGKELKGPAEFVVAVLAPACPEVAVAPTTTAPPIVTATPVPTPVTSVAAVPLATRPPVTSPVPVSPEPTDELAYTGSPNPFLLPISVGLILLGLLATFLSKRRKA